MWEVPTHVYVFFPKIFIVGILDISNFLLSFPSVKFDYITFVHACYLKLLIDYISCQCICSIFTSLAQKPPEPICKAKVDVGFILDSSGSLRNDYQNEKDFLKSLAGAFGVTKDDSRAGVITFSYYSEHSIKLKDHTDITSFNAAVDAIPLMGSTTRIDRALRLTQNELFTLENGARPGIPKILILLTDGSQTQDAGAEDPGVISNELRLSGITVIVVGIGSGTNATELAHMAGGADNAFSAASFDELIGGDFIKQLTDKSCQAGMYYNISI